MKEITRQAVHNFFDSLVAGQPVEEQVHMLRDILVDDFCFNGVTEEISYLEAEVEAGMKADAGKKIMWIKTVREKTGLDLKGAKEFVESLTPGNPLYGQSQYRKISGPVRSAGLDHIALAARLDKIAIKYGKKTDE